MTVIFLHVLREFILYLIYIFKYFMYRKAYIIFYFRIFFYYLIIILHICIWIIRLHFPLDICLTNLELFYVDDVLHVLSLSFQYAHFVWFDCHYSCWPLTLKVHFLDCAMTVRYLWVLTSLLTCIWLGVVTQWFHWYRWISSWASGDRCYYSIVFHIGMTVTDYGDSDRSLLFEFLIYIWSYSDRRKSRQFKTPSIKSLTHSSYNQARHYLTQLPNGHFRLCYKACWRRSPLVMWIKYRFLDTAIDGSNTDCITMLCPWARQHNPHCFSRLSWEMRTRREHPREGCLFSAMSFPKEIALKDQRTFYPVTDLRWYTTIVAVHFWLILRDLDIEKLRELVLVFGFIYVV